MFSFGLSDLYVIISVLIFTISLLLLFSPIVDNFSSGSTDFKYFLIGSVLIFYIAFVYPFMYLNVYIGVILFWIMIIAVNLYLIVNKYSLLNMFKKIKMHLSQKILLMFLLILQILVLYGDAVFHISHSFIDSFYNFRWIFGNVTDIGNVGYFPGLSIVSTLPISLINPFYSLNFFAATLGLVFIICINLILKMIVSFKGLVLFNLVLSTPIFYALTYTRVGLNNSQIFPLMFFSLIVFLNSKWHDRTYLKYIYGLALTIAALTTAPHILFLIIPGIFIAIIITYGKSRYQLMIFIISMTLASIFFASRLSSPDTIFYDRNVNPDSLNFLSSFFVLVNDWLRVKLPIRSPFDSIQSLGSYIIIVFAVWVLLVTKNKNNKPLVFVSVLTIVYGITLQTGIGEFAFMKGRIGWYFMWTSALLLALAYDHFERRVPRMVVANSSLGLIVVISIISVITYPPNAYRIDNEKILFDMRKLVAANKKDNVLVYTDLEYMPFVSKKIKVTVEYMSDNVDYIVLNNRNQIPDYNLANARAYENRNVDEFENNQQILINERLEKNTSILEAATTRGYRIAINNPDYIILTK